jgi:shikimate kinase
MKIAFVGYMGSGKSFCASRLASEIDVPFVDLDSYLEEKYLQSSVSDFIKNKGELAFRKLEKKALQTLSEADNPMVLACGGGTPCYYDNMDVLNSNFHTVYLNCSISTLVSRLTNELRQRPLISHLEVSELKEFVAKHLFERRYYYNQARTVLNENHFDLASMLKILNK